MPANARRRIVDDAAVGIYHCVNRCVRRAFLCGFDSFSGNNYDHRKLWIRQRLEALAGLFAIDVLGFAVMANHLHLVLRNRPDVAAGWSDEEVARRWCGLFPGSSKRHSGANASCQSPQELRQRMLLAAPEQLADCRRRLSSVSWFMRSLCEPIARAANREDEVTGRFWEGRFKSQALLDEAAVLACSLYVDLNPVRAGLAETPEASPFTSAHERILDRLSGGSDLPEGVAGWLAPVAETGDTGIPNAPPKRRASDRGFLPLSLDDYLGLLDWTGRALRHGCQSIPSGLAPIFERLHLSAERWTGCIAEFGKQFHRVAGRAASFGRFAEQSGQRWLHGVAWSRKVFG